MSGLFGGSTPEVNFTPRGFNNPFGYSVSGQGDVTQSPTLQSNLGSLQSTFQQGASAFGNLAATVQPGFSQFRTAGLSDIANSFMAQRSNLKDTLSQRRVLGSSFGNSQFNQLAATEGATKADFEATSYINELQQQQQLLQQEYTYQTQSYSTAINQSNIESGTAAQLTAQNNQIAAQIATDNAKLQAASQAAAGAGIGKLLGAAAGVALAPFTGGASLLAIPGALAGGGGSTNLGLGGGSSPSFTFPNAADLGIGGGIGTGGYNFLDAQAGQ